MFLNRTLASEPVDGGSNVRCNGLLGIKPTGAPFLCTADMHPRISHSCVVPQA
nr:hypothetical protein [Nitrosomonas aestuarii]